MRLTVVLLGHTFDVSLEPTAADEDEAPDPAAPLSGGLLASTPMGFTAQWAAPEDIPLPQRTPAWDEPQERKDRAARPQGT